jgi:transposase
MSTSFRPYDPDQFLLLPPSVREWLPESHLVHFVSDAVESLDLQDFYLVYEGDGRRNRPFDPRMMVKILIYGYATGTFSSRKLAKKLEEDVAFRVLAAGNMPAHRTIAEFRQRHLKAFRKLFVQLVQLACEAGLLKLGTLAVDGSKVWANASKHKAMSYGRMREEEDRLRREIRELTEQAAEVDAEEDRLYGPDKRGDELPKELQRREVRLRKIREAKRRLEERQAAADREKGRRPGDGRKSPRGGRRFKREFGVPEDRAQDNFTDPESRIMKSSKGYLQAYNAQIGVEEDSQLIVGAEVTACAADNDELLGMVNQAELLAGERPKRVLADAGYRSEDAFVELEKRTIDGYVSLGREGKKAGSPPDESLCASRRMLEKLSSEDGKKIYRRRKAIVEPVFGWAKAVLGFRQFSLRGLENVRGEWNLVCLALNLKRMHRIWLA